MVPDRGRARPRSRRRGATLGRIVLSPARRALATLAPMTRLSSILRMLLAVAGGLGVLACGGPSHDGPADAPLAFDAPTTIDVAPGASDGPTAPADVTCTTSAGAITLGIAGADATKVVPASHLAVVFFQLNDDLKPPPGFVVADDVPLAALAAGETRCLDLAPAQIQVPAQDALQLCDRTPQCTDINDPKCACLKDSPQVAVAFVLVAQDTDGNGKLDAAEITKTGLHGAGLLGIAAAAADRAATSPPAHAVDVLFPEGVGKGVLPYRVISTPGQHDTLGRGQPGTTYQVRVCPPGDADCKLHFPNLS
jgi:hypothetical protein